MKEKETIGAFVRIPIDEKYHTYGRIINNFRYAFYDCKTESEQLNIENIEKSAILFKLVVHKNAVVKGFWKIVGVKDLSPDLESPVPFFYQEIGNQDKCEIDINGKRAIASVDECIGLERLAVWEQAHVEQRIKDYYAGKRNNYAYALRINGI